MYNEVFENFPKVETTRLILRKVSGDDVEDIFEYAQDTEAFKFTEGFPSDYDSVKKVIQLWNNDAYNSKRFIRWAIEHKSDEKVIGGIYLFFPEGNDAIGRRMDIGYDFSRKYWGMGYASEAIRAITKFGFEEMGLVRVQAQIIPEHIASIKACEKAGYTNEGTLRNYCPYYHNDIGMKTMTIMGCIPSDYQE